MNKYRNEYRINKKGCECFRTNSFEEAKAKLDQLMQKNPKIYTMQSRHCPVNRVGALMTCGDGKPMWTVWD